MCPTFLATGEEVMSTRGRANMIRAALEGGLDGPDGGGLLAPELAEVLTSCLACKACLTECPSNVDMALLKTNLLQARHRLDGVILVDRVIAAADTVGRLGSAFAPLANRAIRWRPVRALMQAALGLAADRPLPTFARQRFDRWFARRGRSAPAVRGAVILWDDTWVRYHEPGIGQAAVAVLEAAGFEVRLARGRACCGRPAASRGLLDEVRRLGEHNLALLEGGSEPIVFLEPSCWSMFVDEYRQLGIGGAAAVAGRTVLFEDFVDSLLRREPDALPFASRPLQVAVHAHCHAKALGDAARPDRARSADSRGRAAPSGHRLLRHGRGLRHARGHHEPVTAGGGAAPLPDPGAAGGGGAGRLGHLLPPPGRGPARSSPAPHGGAPGRRARLPVTNPAQRSCVSPHERPDPNPEGGSVVDVAYGEALGRAWARARRLLLEPFVLRTWIVMGFTAWLARLAGGGGGGGSTGVRNLGGAGWQSEVERLPDELAEAGRELWSHAVLGPVVVLVVLAVLALVVVLLWLSSRGKLIFYDNVATGRAAVAEPWRRLGRLGDSLFLFRIGFAAAAIGVVGMLLLLGYSVRSSIAGVVGVVALGVVAGLVAAFVAVLLDGFVVPIMVRSRIGVLAAWDVLLPRVSRDPWPFVIYALLLLGLAVLVGIAIAVVGLLTCCAFFVVLALPFVGTVVLLPVLVTYRALGPEVLAAVDPAFAGLLDPLPPSAAAAGDR